MNTETKLANFKKQIEEDIRHMQRNYASLRRIGEDAYAFNYWILDNIYKLAIETCEDNITDRRGDKGIDCFVHYEESKELHIIQNKYYENARLNRRDVADFIQTPIAVLQQGKYININRDLQEAYDKAKNDKEYTVYMYIYVANEVRNEDVEICKESIKDSRIDVFDVIYLPDIQDIVYMKGGHRENAPIEAKLSVKTPERYMKINPDAENMQQAYYVMASVSDIYDLWNKAKERLFDQNVREYLGRRGRINKAIINTLEEVEDRYNFFYYNNGITITCKCAKIVDNEVIIKNPKVINGCQTVSSIGYVLSDDKKKDYQNIHVMTKILVINDTDEEDKSFHRNVVTYTNSQNAIKAEAFIANEEQFRYMQENMKDRGILLLIKSSDKHKFQDEYGACSKQQKSMLDKAQAMVNEDFYKYEEIMDLFVPLEQLLQIIGAYERDAYFAYTKKPYLLKKLSKDRHYEEFTCKVKDNYTSDGIINLLLLFKKASSEQETFLSPFYVLNALGHYLKKENIDQYDFLRKIEKDRLADIYKEFKTVAVAYMTKAAKGDKGYNKVLKEPVDEKIMDKRLKIHFDGMLTHNEEKYKGFMGIFNDMKKVNKTTTPV